ncbi:HvfC/BufC N-terminal domain-containing protein [Luteibacter sp. UNCMF366Tsu5.1]|uniref:HvfC/BufC N-terminal domain-containing protein n=1 Tax=Luteibacter sp. UNCMF366Tsu5.1 TaxID=1502758 RepID=UPI000908A55E|nr:DNA-binding domain-containing protein [Luteibacter sp. UNCMF366Tsu5.1]SFW75799.1 Putative DNA-binding domain-containing protein [Luteibacter sp. UNCMF366Tsu5.1]
MNLAELQHRFGDWLTDATGEDDKPSIPSQANAGFAVYCNNYRAQLIGCLEASYPQVARWIGADAFREAAIHHIGIHPPRSWTLDQYGVDFPDTVFALYPRNPDLYELAWIEWALAEAFVSADTTPLTTEALANVDWDAVTLTLTPSLRVHEATTTADDLWFALDTEAEVPEGEMLDQPGGFVIWRKGFRSQLKRVDAADYAALLALRSDGRFAAWCDVLVERLGEHHGIARAGTLLAEWIGAGIVVDVEIENQGSS